MVQPSLHPPGGGNGVAAWMLQALRDEAHLGLLTWEPVDLARVNAYFGTSLSADDFAVELPSAPLRATVDGLPLPLSSVKIAVLRRRAKQLVRDYDLVIGVHNEADFGRPGIQYIHYPTTGVAPLRENLRWYHGAAVLRAYQRLWSRVSPFDYERMRSNVTLVNSAWTGALVASTHDLPVRVVHPPAAGVFDDVPWEARADGFLCVGRLSPEKRIEDVVEIVGRLRARFPAAHLHIVGGDDHPRYAASIRALAAAAGPWVTLEGTLPFEQLTTLLAQHRYLIHAMREEHFGMSIAQAVRAGCIPFVPAGGGQVEIAGEEPALRYESVDDAVAKIGSVMAAPDQQRAIRARLASRAPLFAPERFVDEIRGIVADALASGGRAPHGR